MEKDRKNYDIIFLLSGSTLPAMLDLALYASNSGLEICVVILERGRGDLIMDSSLVNYDFKIIKVNYKAVSLTRFLSIPAMYLKLKKFIKGAIKKNGIVVPSSYDLLVYTYLISLNHKLRLYYQVRDLHSLQFRNGVLPWLVRNIERIMLKKVEKIFVSSPGFINNYYKHIYTGKTLLLENIPSQVVWKGYTDSKRETEPFFIGFIGIIRYKESLYQLIDAVEELNNQGFNFKVLFAGGGETSDLKKRITNKDFFVFRGAYEYAKEIKNLYNKIDLIYSVYDNKDFNCKVAMPNKFYESIISKKPILVASDTLLAQEVEKKGIGSNVVSGNKASLIEKLRLIKVENEWFSIAKQNLLSSNSDYLFQSYKDSLKEAFL